jgi:hypothetical protein
MGYALSVSFRVHSGGAGPGKGGSMSYEAPQVTDYGTLVELTAAQSTGNFTDRDFPTHTPKDDLTFSD